MPSSQNLSTSPLQVRCPHCGHAEDDDLELLGEAQMDDIRCCQCELVFRMLLLECLACGEETIFSWDNEPPEGDLLRLACAKCQRPYVDHEADALQDDFVA
jgi:hypothetical protein